MTGAACELIYDTKNILEDPDQTIKKFNLKSKITKMYKVKINYSKEKKRKLTTSKSG